MGNNKIFEVDVKGLRQLQEGKPKWFIVRELLQNAMDENVTTIDIEMSFGYNYAEISVTDDSPIGFRDIADAYTLFKDTYKRADATRRGRFNFGEKQVLCMAKTATIETTTGSITFHVDEGFRTHSKVKRPVGSKVWVKVKMSKEDYLECCEYVKQIKPSSSMDIKVHVAGIEPFLLPRIAVHKQFSAKLLTELKQDDSMRRVQRETYVYLYNEPVKYLYEIGIPVCEIDCDYSIDVQQRVPLSNDRDTVDAKYLKTLYGEILNQTIDEISPEQSSSLWVRDGFTSDRTGKETRQEIITKRFGDKALIANPMDKRSMDEAISNNYNVVYGSEMSKEEWSAVRNDGLLVSTSSMFKTGIADGRSVKMDELTEDQLKIAVFCKKVASDMMNLFISVGFYESTGATVKADYSSEGKKLRFNISHFDIVDWQPAHGRVRQDMLDLIIHELGHSAGWHYEHSYHECITKLGAKLTIQALENPGWFKL